ncbi:peptidoglycan-binding protein LysM [Paenibacillus baekrokdamisoli]|uniref:Peptidoglycan-binding protein LysM n=1 Tax=Paenibacillus baekrokdamisoli TaxID=1712516 RepID=A0A3G9J4Z7_9BACL|nr:LysM peptidoglycan-binding domain-containing protein [Paenibacillus baekrokdamisoli]MBB3070483.1 LysM repeat protein [Paenibacillus baekrokdamisoli]BBH19833.1 peptidoglycan-binding protein LysM [Paenibacillus baekrokdamisoli]
MDAYEIELSYNSHAEFFSLPVLPETINVKEDGNGKTYTVAGIGEINVIKDPSLKEISFESIFPAHNYPFIQEGVAFRPPGSYVQRIEHWKATKHPIRFIFIGGFEINIPVSIESFEWSEIAGSGGDIEFKLSLKEYVFYGAKKIKVVKKKSGTTTKQDTPSRPNEKQTPKTYTMVAGDTLSKVAKKLLGDDSRWREIQKLNGLSDADLKKLPIGKVLKLPNK